MRPQYRFAELQLRAGAYEGLMTMTIRDETRYVLHAYKWAPVAFALDKSIPHSAHLSSRLLLKPPLTGGSRVVLDGRVRGRGGWMPMPQTIARVEREGEDEFVQLELEFPRIVAGTRADFAVHGYLPPDGTRSSHQTPEVEISTGSRLEFGTGILEPARTQGPVKFSVEVCEAADCRPIFGETRDPEDPNAQGWRDHAIPLGEYAGKTVSFRFETSLIRTAPEAFSLAVWSNPTVYAPVRRAPDEPNIILLSLDTLRADRLTSYGYPLDTAPFIDEKFGRGGTVFESLVSAEATTAPSHMSMFTSLQPSVHGVTGGLKKLPPNLSLVTLAESLRDHEFETGAFTENGALFLGMGFERGFNSYAENKSPSLMLPTGQIDVTFARAREWLERHGDKRFFLFLHTYQVHYPYAPPQAYKHFFPVPAKGYEPHPGLAESHRPVLYDQEIRYVDDELRKFFGMLEERGLARSTIFVLTSDHGEEFLEHGFIGHGPHLYAEVNHVPLMFWGPGIPRGRRVAQPVGHVDLMPTILELAGVPIPGGGMGRSFADLLRAGADADVRAPAPLYSEAWTTMGVSVQIEEPTLAVRLGDRKLIRARRDGGFEYEYFDLRADPREEHDLYEEMAPQLHDLKELIDGYPQAMAKLKAELTRNGGKPVSEGAGEHLLDPAREEKLRALGYLD